MACIFYNANGCSGCKHFVKTTAVEIDTDVLVLVLPEAIYNDKEKVCICVAQDIPSITDTVTYVAVRIGSGTTNFPLITEYAEIVRPEQIRSRKVYHTIAAGSTSSFRICQKELCRAYYRGNITIPPAAPAPTTRIISKGVKKNV